MIYIGIVLTLILLALVYIAGVLSLTFRLLNEQAKEIDQYHDWRIKSHIRGLQVKVTEVDWVKLSNDFSTFKMRNR